MVLPLQDEIDLARALDLDYAMCRYNGIVSLVCESQVRMLSSAGMSWK